MPITVLSVNVHSLETFRERIEYPWERRVSAAITAKSSPANANTELCVGGEGEGAGGGREGGGRGAGGA